MRPLCQPPDGEIGPARKPAPETGLPVPATTMAVYELLGWLDSPPFPNPNLGRILRLEPGLAATALRTAAEGRSGWCESLSSSVALLGRAGLQKLALTVPLLDPAERRHQRMLDVVARSRRTAHLAECLALECNGTEPEWAYVAGLLVEFRTLEHLWWTGQFGWGWMERDGLEEALELTRVWHFPPPVSMALACRERPEEADEQQLLVRLVGLAAASSKDAVLEQAAGGGGPLLRATELVKQYLPKFSLPRQLALAEMLTTEYKRCCGGRIEPAPPGGGNGGRIHG